MTTRLLKEVFQPYTHYCVGSLPFDTATDAIEFILERPHIVPFWPELPQRDRREESLARALRALEPGWDGYSVDEAMGLYALKGALHEMESPPSIVKAQCLGPLSTVVYGDDGASQFDTRYASAVEACWKQILWQLEFLSGFEIPILLVIDEPALQDWEKFSDDSQLRIMESYNYFYIRVAETRNYLGIHNCGRFTPAILDLSFDLISFDALHQESKLLFSDQLKPLWRDAIKRGLCLAPGVLASVCDTDFESAIHEADNKRKELENIFYELTGDAQGFLLSATCGHATAPVEWLHQAYR